MRAEGWVLGLGVRSERGGVRGEGGGEAFSTHTKPHFFSYANPQPCR